MPGLDTRGTAAPDGSGPRRPRAPDHRPAWFVLLTSLTLLYGGVLLVASLETWRDPHAPTRLPEAQALTPAEDAIAQKLVEADERVVTAHARTIRGDAAASVPLALLMLFAAATMLSRDRRGRTVVLTAAWTGIAHQLAMLWLTYPIVRDFARDASPLLAQLASLQTQGQDPRASPEFFAKVVLAFPVVMTGGAIVGSLILIRYFGGRRGRVLYGLERAQSPR